MTDVKLFDENAPFQVKGLHMRGRLRICNAFYFSFCKGRKKKENLEIQTYIIRKRQGCKVGKNITEIESLLLLPIAFFFTSNMIFIVDVGYLRCLLFFFSCSCDKRK